MAYAGIDCATKLTLDSARALKDQGITHVCRYLNPGWKGLTVEEVKALSEAGLEIVSVYETNPTQASYFTHDQGKQDAQDASKYAKSLDQTDGSAIYFTVDYDAQGKDLGDILDYFSGVIEGIDSSFKVGAYGSYSVLNYLKQQSKVEYCFQTYAWSNGQVCDFAHLYQHENGVNVAGINVDRDQVNKDPGSWSLPKPQPKVEVHGTYSIQQGDTFWELEQAHGWQHGVLSELNPGVDARRLSIGQKINVPETINQPVYHTVQKGENLSLIASHSGLSLAQIEGLNHQLKGHYDLIQPGEKVRIK